MSTGQQFRRPCGETTICLGVFLALSAMVDIARADLLITNWRGNSVLRYDDTTGAFLGELVASESGGLKRPIGLAVGPDGLLYVSGSESDNILRYNLQTGAFVDEFVGSGPDGIDYPLSIHFGPDGHLYAGSFGTQSIRKYDGTTGAFLGTWATEPSLNDPLDFTFSSTGQLFVSGYASGALYHFDAAGNFVQKLAEEFGDSEPWGITFGPDGNLYAASYLLNGIGRLNGTTFEYIDTFVDEVTLAGPGSIAFGPDGNLYVANWNVNNVHRYDGVTGTFLGEFVAKGSGGLFGPKAILFVNVPEPATWVMALTGLLAMPFLLRSRHRGVRA
ncbi:MAG: NHL repeat-containing protein [Pirellulales bacterium]|nr:NHL repeat-containing protein [Pirellulales bacterium]